MRLLRLAHLHGLALLIHNRQKFLSSAAEPVVVITITVVVVVRGALFTIQIMLLLRELFTILL
jgi:hypothetical protein